MNAELNFCRGGKQRRVDGSDAPGVSAFAAQSGGPRCVLRHPPYLTQAERGRIVYSWRMPSGHRRTSHDACQLGIP